MKFEEALKAMKAGSKAKLPSWGGYWYWSPEKETIIMHTKDGQELDIRETQSVVYTLQNILSDEWIIADGMACISGRYACGRLDFCGGVENEKRRIFKAL